jgi:hypothetical protein
MTVLLFPAHKILMFMRLNTLEKITFISVATPARLGLNRSNKQLRHQQSGWRGSMMLRKGTKSLP